MTLDPERHTITGIARVSLAPQDPRPRDSWWFMLPPNRFTEPDARGVLEENTPLPYQWEKKVRPLEDIYYPDGFDRGEIQVLAVTDAQGTPLTWSLEPNPNLQTGYAVAGGLLRVNFLPGAPGGEAVIYFRTVLPKRLQDGWTEQGVFARQWHPVLARWQNGQWAFTDGLPSPGRFEVDVFTLAEGWLITARRAPHWLSPNTPFRDNQALWSDGAFPLVFLPEHQIIQETHDGVEYSILFSGGDAAKAMFVLELAPHFVNHMTTRQGLALPAPSVTLVEVEGPPGQFTTWGQTVFIPQEWYRNSRLLDRLLMGKLTVAMGHMWWGETVWSDRLHSAWISDGLAGYYSLVYFQELYGWDAPVQTVGDWLAPRYREHYFEVPSRRLILQGKDLPLDLDWTRETYRLHARVVTHAKAPLFFRSLGAVMGPPALQHTLRDVYARQAMGELDEEGLKQSLRTASPLPLEDYFHSWLEGTPRYDYALSDWREEWGGEGYLLKVEVERLGPSVMPVEVRVESVTGQTQTQTWSGREEKTELTFALTQPVSRIALDPEENILELDRKNNDSQTHLKIRPLFDWYKDREIMVSVFMEGDGNPVDGNIYWLGLNTVLDSDNTIQTVLGYGQTSHQTGYKVGWLRKRFFHPALAMSLSVTKTAGKKGENIGFSFTPNLPDDLGLKTTLGYTHEKEIQAAGGNSQPLRSSFLSLVQGWDMRWVSTYVSVMGQLDYSSPDLDSDFSYRSPQLILEGGWRWNVNHLWVLKVSRASAEGLLPPLSRHPLGGPGYLAGYPRSLDLTFYDTALLSVDYEWTFSHEVWGTGVQFRKWVLVMSAGAGAGWNTGQNPAGVPIKKNAGIGLNVELSVMNHQTFPLDVQVAWPLGDPAYTQGRLILLGDLSF
ncbi:MAG: hypothetical protein OEV94_08885 [Deltaproteobacteria bacterium]|nr:hypothetical protein [Deltaproteobacteria bacterium]